MDHNPSVMKLTNGYLTAGVSNRKTDKGNYEYKVVLWKLDARGKELWVKDLNLPGLHPDRPFLPERCFSLQDEPTLLIIETLGPKPRRAWLMRLDETGDVVSSKELAPRQVFDIQGLRKTNNGLLLYGSVHKADKNSDACVTKITFDGNEIWRREFDKGKMEWGMGLAPQKDGGFILAADSGNYNKFGGGPSQAWIIKCDPNGNILCETTFEGRHPTVTLNGDITAVVFNKEDFPQQDMAVVALDTQMKTLWRIDSLFGKTGGLGMLATTVNKQGNFILAGSKFGAAGLWEVSKAGNRLQEIEIEGAKHCVRFDCLLLTPTGYLVAGSTSKMSQMPLGADGKRDENVQWDTMDILITEVADLSK